MNIVEIQQNPAVYLLPYRPEGGKRKRSNKFSSLFKLENNTLTQCLLSQQSCVATGVIQYNSKVVRLMPKC